MILPYIKNSKKVHYCLSLTRGSICVKSDRINNDSIGVLSKSFSLFSPNYYNTNFIMKKYHLTYNRETSNRFPEKRAVFSIFIQLVRVSWRICSCWSFSSSNSIDLIFNKFYDDIFLFPTLSPKNLIWWLSQVLTENFNLNTCFVSKGVDRAAKWFSRDGPIHGNLLQKNPWAWLRMSASQFLNLLSMRIMIIYTPCSPLNN